MEINITFTKQNKKLKTKKTTTNQTNKQIEMIWHFLLIHEHINLYFILYEKRQLLKRKRDFEKEKRIVSVYKYTIYMYIV